MLRKILIALGFLALLGCGVIGLFLWVVSGIMHLDEEEILTESSKAYQKEEFCGQVFEKKEEIRAFLQFLDLYADTLVQFKRIQDSIDNEGGVRADFPSPQRYFIMEDDSILHATVPNYLIDKFLHYKYRLFPDLLTGIYLCSGQECGGSSFPTVRMVLKISKEDEFNPNYYLYHYLTSDTVSKKIGSIQSIDGPCLRKDTLLLPGLNYVIEICPYSGH
ncbi:MAG: hypothetical protein IAE84_17790 [Saprospiraceae bacterium]|nr:hypothetical protein [Saprospiraceae bacterium]